MGINEEVKAVPATHVVHGGTADVPKDRWVPFEWEEPGLGRQVQGEMAVIRPFGTSGNLTAGFWRTGSTSPGASKDGSHRIVYSAPLGDETACVLEGCATLTVKATGRQFRVAPGSIISTPKNLEVLWEIEGPYFKKYWCIFDGSEKTPGPPQDLLVSNVSDNPPDWQEYHFTEPKEGALIAGELIAIRGGGSTGTMLSGLWRSGKGIWISKGPFSKKLWVITRDQLPA